MNDMIVAVVHDEFREMGVEDVRGMFDVREAEVKGFCYEER